MKSISSASEDALEDSKVEKTSASEILASLESAMRQLNRMGATLVTAHLSHAIELLRESIQNGPIESRPEQWDDAIS